MKRQSVQRLTCTAASLALVSLVSRARAGINVDGTLDSSYGTALAVQTIETGFGDNTLSDGSSGYGSELDAAYGTVTNNILYLFFAGNYQNNGNHLNIFIADGRSGGQNVLNANTSSGSLGAANGLTFPTGFNATYVIDANDTNSTLYVDQYDLTRNAANYLGSVSLTNGIGSNQNLTGISVGLNNTNIAGVGGNGGAAANQSAASAVTTGFEVGIPLSALGNPTGSVQVLAGINGGGNVYYSNQFLPGLPVGYGNLGGPQGVNFQTNGSNITPFSVSIPASANNGNWLPTGGGSWNSSANWSNGIIPNAAGATATFASATNNSNVSLDGHFTVGVITFNSTYTYNITTGSGGQLTLDNGTNASTITSYGGSQIISAPVVVNSNTAVTAVSHGDSISLSGNISGSGALTFFNLGTDGNFPVSDAILSGSNTYSGGTTVTGGTLTLGLSTALPVDSALTLSAVDVPAGVLDLNGFSASVSSLNVPTGTLTVGLNIVVHILNSSATPGNATLTYAGNNSNPSSFQGIISDNADNGGSTTSLLLTSGALTLTNTNTYAGSTSVNGGSLALGIAGALPTGTNLNIGSGALVIASPFMTPTAVSVGSLSVVGKLDLNNNGLIMHTGSVSAVAAALKTGFAGGSWNGSSGIISSTATTDSTGLTALGVIINDTGANSGGSTGTAIYNTLEGVPTVAGDVLVKYTYYGDANLSGAVDGSDYSLIDNGYLNHLTGWYNGDFNYDGVIDGSDYTLIDNAFNSQGANLTSELANASAAATAQVAGSGSAVPEPASLSLLGIGAMGLLSKRRRHR